MLTIAAYFDQQTAHVDELTDEIWANGLETVRRANILLCKFYADGGKRRELTSGWRPPTVNAAITGASRGSNHLTGKAVDIGALDRSLARWCAANKEMLEVYGIWMERPEATPTWCHWQTVPPGSQARYYWPTVVAYRLWVASSTEPIIV